MWEADDSALGAYRLWGKMDRDDKTASVINCGDREEEEQLPLKACLFCAAGRNVKAGLGG